MRKNGHNIGFFIPVLVSVLLLSCGIPSICYVEKDLIKTVSTNAFKLSIPYHEQDIDPCTGPSVVLSYVFVPKENHDNSDTVEKAAEKAFKKKYRINEYDSKNIDSTDTILEFSTDEHKYQLRLFTDNGNQYFRTPEWNIHRIGSSVFNSLGKASLTTYPEAGKLKLELEDSEDSMDYKVTSNILNFKAEEEEKGTLLIFAVYYIYPIDNSPFCNTVMSDLTQVAEFDLNN